MNPELTLSDEALGDIDFSFKLLEGRHVPSRISSFEFDAVSGFDPTARGELYMTSTLAFEIDGQALGNIPVGLTFPGFTIERVSGSSKLRAVCGEEGRAWVFARDPAEDDGQIFATLRSKRSKME